MTIRSLARLLLLALSLAACGDNIQPPMPDAGVSQLEPDAPSPPDAHIFACDDPAIPAPTLPCTCGPAQLCTTAVEAKACRDHGSCF